MDLRRIYVLLKAEIFPVSVSQLHVEGVNNYYKMYEWSLSVWFQQTSGVSCRISSLTVYVLITPH